MAINNNMAKISSVPSTNHPWTPCSCFPRMIDCTCYGFIRPGDSANIYSVGLYKTLSHDQKNIVYGCYRLIIVLEYNCHFDVT